MSLFLQHRSTAPLRSALPKHLTHTHPRLPLLRFPGTHPLSTSHTPPPNTQSADSVKSQLLSTALSLVPVHSFSSTALLEAAKMMDLPSTICGLAPNGPRDIILHLFEQGILEIQNQHALLIKDTPDVKMTKTVVHLSRKRLQFMIPYIYQWPDAVKILAHPHNVPFAIHHLHHLVDEIWFLAGDRSYDTNYYSKRALLAGIYASTEVFMTTDKSHDFMSTWQFLDARFRDSAQFGKSVAQIKSSLDWGANTLRGIFISKGF